MLWSRVCHDLRVAKDVIKSGLAWRVRLTEPQVSFITDLAAEQPTTALPRRRLAAEADGEAEAGAEAAARDSGGAAQV